MGRLGCLGKSQKAVELPKLVRIGMQRKGEGLRHLIWHAWPETDALFFPELFPAGT